MRKRQILTKTQTQAITDYQTLIKRWSVGDVLTQNMTRDQIRLVKGFVKKDIPWVSLTGTK